MLQFVGRLLLVIVNTILALLALLHIALGFMVKYAPQTFSTYTGPILDSIAKSANGSFGDSDFTTDSFSLDGLFGSVAIVLIVLGFTLLAISIFGCCGACCGIKCMLLGYAVVMSILVIAQIISVVLVYQYSDVLKSPSKTHLKSLLKNFQGLNGTNVESLAWNFAMQEFECCGIDDYMDFKESNTQWFGEDNSNWKTPVACCKTLPTTTAEFECAQVKGNDAAVNNYNKGCVDEIWKAFLENISLYIGVAISLALQILMVIFALVLFFKDDDKKVSPI